MASLLQMTDMLTLNHCAVLHDLDFDVAEGDIQALLGSNGSGKSAFALMAHGLSPDAAVDLIVSGILRQG